MARDQNQELEDMALVDQQDEFNAPAGQEQVIIEGQVLMEEQKLEQPRVEGQGVAGQGVLHKHSNKSGIECINNQKKGGGNKLEYQEVNPMNKVTQG